MIRAPKICGRSHIRAGLSGYVAELSSAIIGAELALPVKHLDHHASYIDHWLDVLKRDDRAILTAAAKAEEASSLLLELGGRRTCLQDEHADLASVEGGAAPLVRAEPEEDRRWEVMSVIPPAASSSILPCL